MTFQLPNRAVLTASLAALELVVLDTETTGLDVARDAIIELAGLRVRAGEVIEDGHFASLVNPGRPISAASAKIHGLSDAEVAAAPRFPEVMHAFAEWAGALPLAGYMIGFDLAIMRAEHHRHGLRWQQPLALDVQGLARLVAPRLPEFSLEALAAWLDISAEGRHRALADARIAAHIFVKLVPMLAERGIRTLAQALRATERQQQPAAAAAPGLPAEWALEKPAQWQGGRQMDSYPFRHRVCDVMNDDLAIISPAATLEDALRQMLKRQVSSLFVQPEVNAGAGCEASESSEASETAEAAIDHWGIITERDILRAIAAHGPSVLKHALAQYASFPLITVPEHEFLYRAMARMQALGLRHLGVRSRAEERIIGAISQRDLLRYRASESVVLAEHLQRAATAEELAALWPMLVDVARAMQLDNAPPSDIAAVIAREARALTRRACELAEQEMREVGRGGPPVSFGLLVLGSVGRGESLLAMDQDNAIIYATPKESRVQEVDAWFAGFATRVNDMLATAGVPLCPGGVMAGNAPWRRSEREWLATVRNWLGSAGPRDLLHVDIFFDLRRACGDRELVRRFRRQVLDMAKDARTLLKFLALQAAEFDSPLGWFGRIRTDEQGRVDLKKGGLMPIYSAARVLALRLGSMERATPRRLRAAAEAGICAKATAQNLIEAHRILLGAVLGQQLRDIEVGLPPSNRVAVAGLGSYERDELRWALEQVREVPALLDVPDVRVG